MLKKLALAEWKTKVQRSNKKISILFVFQLTVLQSLVGCFGGRLVGWLMACFVGWPIACLAGGFQLATTSVGTVTDCLA